MRILHVIPSIAARRGGPSEVVFRLAQAQRSLGLEAEIATSDEDHGGIMNGERILHQDVPVYLFRRALTRWRLLREFAFCPAFAAWLRQHITSYDVLHVHALFSHLPTTAMRVARRAGVPYLSRPLGELGHWPLRQSAWKKALYLKVVERANLRGAAAIHFTSESEREEAEALELGAHGLIVPHGIVPPPFRENAGGMLRRKLGLAPDRPLVLFLGRLHAKKGLDLLLRALALLPEPRPILLIAGVGPEKRKLQRLADELKITGDIRWLDLVGGEWKELLFAGADLFALTSHHENFGVAVLEALAAGTPVLISPFVALAEMVTDNDLGWVAPLDPAAIAAHLRRGIATPSKAARLRRREFIEANFSWIASARGIHQAYADAARSNSPQTASASNNTMLDDLPRHLRSRPR